MLPTLADCTPFVFCEAFSFSLPVITNDVGGIREMIEYRQGGIVFDCNTSPEQIAADIAAIIADESRYDQLCVNAMESYIHKFNWVHWGREMATHIQELTSNASE